MVKDFYKDFGFQLISQENDDTVWELKIDDYKKRKGFTREFNGVNYEYKKYNP